MMIGLRNRYVSIFGSEPAEKGELDLMEKKLGVRFPEDFKEVSTFYSGGILGGISHNAFAARGPANNITDETKRLRDTAGLPDSFVVLAEPPASLIVMNTNLEGGSPVVVWCDAFDVSRLGTLQEMHDPQTWGSYAEFFKFLLDMEEEERADG
jgi:hypothetical protein